VNRRFHTPNGVTVFATLEMMSAQVAKYPTEFPYAQWHDGICRPTSIHGGTGSGFHTPNGVTVFATLPVFAGL
jgi:hypothetical protein